MNEKDRKTAGAIVEACERARRRLYGEGSAKQRRGQAQLCLSAYENAGVLGPFVRDFRAARTLAVAETTLAKLEGMARRFAEPE